MQSGNSVTTKTLLKDRLWGLFRPSRKREITAIQICLLPDPMHWNGWKTPSASPVAWKPRHHRVRGAAKPEGRSTAFTAYYRVVGLVRRNKRPFESSLSSSRTQMAPSGPCSTSRMRASMGMRCASRAMSPSKVTHTRPLDDRPAINALPCHSGNSSPE